MFRWRYLDEQGEPAGTSEGFAHRLAAEEWLAEAWSTLRDRGVEGVVLVDESTSAELYQMSLAEES